MTFTTPDDVLQGARNPIYNVESVLDIPYAAMAYIGKPFRGFDPIPSGQQWWFHSSIMPDGAFWVILQAMFWIFWLNLILGVTNALPAVPFDGGFLFRDGVGAIVDRTHRNAAPERREKITNTVSSLVSYAMLFALLLVMFVMIF
ncbi:MAG: site-2 protease family protein, partial [Methanomassiliicoccaceae archaeon]|jgi:membrane-associated protease RseP (regulator of RpoE activity)|nr:site-2 protease family protein [Methanomassiliicoccaceae archaeon]